MIDRSFLVGLRSGVEIHIDPFVPELVQPPPCKRLRDRPSRRGGKRTDFGRHFRADAFARGSAAPAPQPRPGYFMIGGVCHMHPKVFAMLKEAFKTPFKTSQPLLYMDSL